MSALPHFGRLLAALLPLIPSKITFDAIDQDFAFPEERDDAWIEDLFAPYRELDDPEDHPF